MRYIPKPDNSSAKTLLESAKMVMRGAGIAELYNNFKEKKQLNDILREEQKHICCYCQCRIDHFKEIMWVEAIMSILNLKMVRMHELTFSLNIQICMLAVTPLRDMKKVNNIAESIRQNKSSV